MKKIVSVIFVFTVIACASAYAQNCPGTGCDTDPVTAEIIFNGTTNTNLHYDGDGAGASLVSLTGNGKVVSPSGSNALLRSGGIIKREVSDITNGQELNALATGGVCLKGQGRTVELDAKVTLEQANQLSIGDNTNGAGVTTHTLGMLEVAKAGPCRQMLGAGGIIGDNIKVTKDETATPDKLTSKTTANLTSLAGLGASVCPTSSELSQEAQLVVVSNVATPSSSAGGLGDVATNIVANNLIVNNQRLSSNSQIKNITNGVTGGNVVRHNGLILGK